jgi:hypothetical protein
MLATGVLSPAQSLSFVNIYIAPSFRPINAWRSFPRQSFLELEISSWPSATLRDIRST